MKTIFIFNERDNSIDEIPIIKETKKTFRVSESWSTGWRTIINKKDRNIIWATTKNDAGNKAIEYLIHKLAKAEEVVDKVKDDISELIYLVNLT